MHSDRAMHTSQPVKLSENLTLGVIDRFLAPFYTARENSEGGILREYEHHSPQNQEDS
jgi:hypothetical protein